MKRISYLLFALLITFSLTNCADDGDPGPAGADGTDGVDGVDGKDGVGFDEIAKYGGFMTYLDGIRPDDIAFKDTSNFKFVPIEYLSDRNIVTISGTRYSFNLQRFISAPDDVYQQAYSDLSLTVESGATPTFSNFSISISKDIVTPDFKVFDMSNTFSSSNYTDLVIDNYSYTPSTGSLKFTFSFNVAGTSNATDNDLSVSGEVDAIVLQQM
ncbi:hypothetical protein [Fulvivirga sediminis]|uniref:Collagen-like protein n=1 Tax=Fulvivirga sediminis TaxID=2803949 RepID=A0A937F8C2_9BACT|nr:hypothetical protein [Fulvivirga sediminis]MBL3657001.1 hypothetical protein [Fulvivirga sediminis]